ncbi:hypothetical protein FHX74_001708 [Friedmanniella endophytica]|uniref:mannan endo-1,4-beta-mannosidase n=1 Tax=Microlunatus kandeliicorticis TaxID=1759536 RepID=A0A7W3IS03_9ACTN|nr:carbohydrate binding domain-containing protein [Microlunatus kandeliicorticis]MBA8794103.1 hypothetical protein [Microlunatus kandeliicorticis]
MTHLLRRLGTLLAGSGLVAGLVLGLGVPTPASAAPGAPRAAASRFVTRVGTALQLDGKPFRFSGPNMYWTGLDENVGGIDPSAKPTVDYPSFFRIRDGLVTAKAMGSTVVRAHTVGISTGSPLSLEPSLGRFNPKAFATMDYTVAEAHRLGLRLIVPLTDNYRYYHGGRFDFLTWLGLSTANDGALFYTDPDARAAYQQYVRTLLTHVNIYTGVRYDQDPTIMAWELGNELNGMTADWVQDNATFVKRLAPHQLVAAGRQSGVDPAVLASSAVDISDSHYYPPNAATISADAARVTAAGKVYLAGEYGSPSASTDLLDQVAADRHVSGALFWSLFPHADHYGYVQHDDGFTLHYPGDTTAMRAEVDAIAEFAHQLSGSPTPRVFGDPPLITAISKNAGVNTVSWRGTAGADGYRVQRSVLDGGWKTVSGSTPVTDDDTPWIDVHSVAVRSSYRVQALDRNGSVVATSTARTVTARQRVSVDPLADWYLTSAHSSSLQRVPTAHGVLVAPQAGRSGQLSYHVPGLTSAVIDFAGAHRPRPVIALEQAGTSRWHQVYSQVRSVGSGRWRLTLTGLRGVDGLRISWPASGASFAVTSVAWTDVTEVPTAAPGSFAVTAPAPGQTGVSTLAGLQWSSAGQAAFYTLTASTHSDLSDPLVSVDGLRATAYRPSTPWPADTTLYVGVTAHNGVGTTAATGSPITFHTRPATPGVLVDDFDSYADDAAVAAAYPANSGGDPITASLGPAGEDVGHSLVLSYGSGSNGYAGVIHTLPAAQHWSGTSGLRMWVKPGFAGQQLNVQFVASGSYWEKSVTLSDTTARVITIPFSAFAPPPWADPNAKLDLSSVTQLSLYPSESGSSDTIAIDSISATP